MTGPEEGTVLFCQQYEGHSGGTFLVHFFSSIFVARISDKDAPLFQVHVRERGEGDSAAPPGDTGDYWGWWENKDNKFLFVWPSRVQLDMCFPYGMAGEEEQGNGRGMPVTIDMLRQVPPDEHDPD